MKTAEQIASEIRAGLSQIRSVCDPVLTSGKSLIESHVLEAQKDALLRAREIAFLVTGGCNCPITDALTDEIDKLHK